MLAVAALFLFSVSGRMTPKSMQEPYDIDGFARIPVKEGGRVKPLETVARVYLRTISHQETFEDENGDTQPAIRWYIDLLAAESIDDDSPAWKHRVFRIENDQVRDDLKLPKPQGAAVLDEGDPAHAGRSGGEGGRRAPEHEGQEAGGPDRHEDDRAGGADRDGPGKLSRLKALNAEGKDTLLPLPPEKGESWASLADTRADVERVALVDAQEALRADPEAPFRMTPEQERRLVLAVTRTDITQLSERARAERLMRVVQVLNAPARSVPPEFRGQLLDALYVVLQPADVARLRAEREKDYQERLAASPAAADWERMIGAYRDRKPEEFNKAVAEYRDTRLAGVPTSERLRARAEVTYNRFAPFYQCTGLYVFGLLLALAGFVCYVAEAPRWAVANRRAATLVLLLTLLVHTVAARRPHVHLGAGRGVFVTNLYSSAVFIGWGCVALCLVLEPASSPSASATWSRPCSGWRRRSWRTTSARRTRWRCWKPCWTRTSGWRPT